MLEDRLLETLKADYLEMCEEVGVEFNSEKFETYLDSVFNVMSEIFMEVQNDSSI